MYKFIRVFYDSIKVWSIISWQHSVLETYIHTCTWMSWKPSDCNFKSQFRLHQIWWNFEDPLLIIFWDQDNLDQRLLAPQEIDPGPLTPYLKPATSQLLPYHKYAKNQLAQDYYSSAQCLSWMPCPFFNDTENLTPNFIHMHWQNNRLL